MEMTISARPPILSAQALADDDHERIVVRQDRATGTRFVVAVHSTVLGPALGGLRLKRYPGGLREAMADAMGLARTMTLKASAAGLALGGGKAVMIDDGVPHMRDARLEVAARTVDELGGDYVTAEDIGTTTADMDLMSRFTPYVVGRSPAAGGGGDPSPVTAETVFRSVGCGLRAATGSADLDGRRVGIVGLGKVGYALGAKLAAGGAEVIACDLDPERVERFADEHGGQAAPSAEAVLATRARRALALRRRRDDRRRDRALDRLPGGGGRGQQPAREPRGGGHARAARDPLRARLPRQLRRADPCGRRVVRRRGALPSPCWWTGRRRASSVRSPRPTPRAPRRWRWPSARPSSGSRRRARELRAPGPGAPIYSNRFAARL